MVAGVVSVLGALLISCSVEAQPTQKVQVAAPVVQEEERLTDLGEFMLTAYCGCRKCNGKWAGITSTGVKPLEGRTVAVDPDVIPYGTTVIINGNEYIAEDCGGAIKGYHIDIYFDSHEDALDHGVQYSDVYVREGKDES